MKVNWRIDPYELHELPKIVESIYSTMEEFESAMPGDIIKIPRPKDLMVKYLTLDVEVVDDFKLSKIAPYPLNILISWNKDFGIKHVYIDEGNVYFAAPTDNDIEVFEAKALSILGEPLYTYMSLRFKDKKTISDITEVMGFSKSTTSLKVSKMERLLYQSREFDDYSLNGID